MCNCEFATGVYVELRKAFDTVDHSIQVQKLELIGLEAFQKMVQFLLKGYLCYKTITSQNVLSKAQIKNFFISQKSYVPFSRYSSFCIFNHPMIYQISDVTMSISTWDKVHFWIYLLNHNSCHQTWPVDRYKQGQ